MNQDTNEEIKQLYRVGQQSQIELEGKSSVYDISRLSTRNQMEIGPFTNKSAGKSFRV